MKCEFDETNKCWDETVMSNMQFCPGEKPLAERQKEKSGRPRAQCGCSEGYPETAPLLVETPGTVISISIYFAVLKASVFSLM